MMYVIFMHRTQILLKPHQYEALKARARQEGKSLSEVIRIAVSQWLGDEPRARKARLADLCNLGRDPRGPAGRDHDSILYQWKRK
jgi:Arc/MetJ-type ribon-helix-helix transcriptional regulator